MKTFERLNSSTLIHPFNELWLNTYYVQDSANYRSYDNEKDRQNPWTPGGYIYLLSLPNKSSFCF